MADLSPAAQAVLAAYGNRVKADPLGRWVEPAIAAALQAAVDNAPAPHHHEEMAFQGRLYRDAFHSGFWAGIEYIRSIATELDIHG